MGIFEIFESYLCLLGQEVSRGVIVGESHSCHFQLTRIAKSNTLIRTLRQTIFDYPDHEHWASNLKTAGLRGATQEREFSSTPHRQAGESITDANCRAQRSLGHKTIPAFDFLFSEYIAILPRLQRNVR